MGTSSRISRSNSIASVTPPSEVRLRIRARPGGPVRDNLNRTNVQIEIVYRRADSLRAYERDLKKKDEKHIVACMGSLRAFGFLAPVIVDSNNVIVDGQALVAAAQRLGIDQIPVVELSHLSPELIRACRLALNKLSEGRRWNERELGLELAEIKPILDAHDIEVEALGIDIASYDLLVGINDEEPTEPDVPLLSQAAITQQGNLWVLGQHRLLCGNALEDADFERLMGGQKARMAFCDGPYNLRVDGVISGLGKAKHREFAMASGEMSRPEFIAFLTGYMRNCAAHSVDGSIHFACMDWRHVLELITAGEAAFDKFLNLVVWAKTNAGMGSMYRSQHELIGVFKSGTAPHQNNFGLGETGRWRSNLWTVAGANTFSRTRDQDLADHPTVKPTVLVMEAIRDVSRPGEIVLDCFCGSGTTILAAEKTGRRCHGIELDPIYVDVAIRRWQELTGKAAVLDGDGRTFEEISSARALAEEPNHG